ncbi:MAG: hypothetical protein H7338_24340 [Candidatus Sericytochromatia bacterium]|nr:hypothetical protein [Candidatus Sericytochromatia bacterium]
MIRRIVLTAMIIVATTAAGCQTLSFSTPTPTQSAGPTQVTVGGTAGNPLLNTSPSPAPATSPATGASPATPASPAASASADRAAGGSVG